MNAATSAESMSPAEFRWSIALFVFWLGMGGLMIASLFTKRDVYTYLAGASALLYAVCRWRVRIYEEERDPSKRRRSSAAAYWVFLLLIYPLVALALMVLYVIAALIKGGSLLTAIGWGALIAALAILVWGLLEMLGRFARRFVR